MKRSGIRKLTGNFPRVSAAKWKKSIENDLKGADYDKKLVWKPESGLEINPFYCREDTENLTIFPAPAPGVFPFTRERSEWKICEDIPPVSFSRAAKAAREASEGGADWVLFRASKAKTRADISTMLSQTDISKTGVCFAPPDGGLAQAAAAADFFEKQRAKPQGFVLCDPIGVEDGAKNAKRDAKKLAKLLRRFADINPSYGCVGVCGSRFHELGAGAVEEAAFALALGTEYLALLLENGVSTEHILRAMVFHFSADSVFFMQTAKLRAVRAVWAHIVRKFDGSADGRMRTHISVSAINKPVCDPEVNIIRATVESMAAVAGGCGSLSIAAFDCRFSPSNSSSQAVARNTQLILRDECGLGKVADPCAGSYYADVLTDRFANAALNLFLEIEKRGGFLKCAQNGFISGRISESAGRTAVKVAAGRRALIGVNRYPIEAEKIADRLKGSKPSGLGKDFEMLRAATEKYAAAKGKTPLVFLVKTGDPAMSNARAVFTANFFAAAGFETDDGGTFSSAKRAAAKAASSGADVFVVCSEDANYGRFVPPFAVELEKNTKNPVVAVAGNPPEGDKIKCENAGVCEFINIRSNILETLKKIQRQIADGKK